MKKHTVTMEYGGLICREGFFVIVRQSQPRNLSFSETRLKRSFPCLVLLCHDPPAGILEFHSNLPLKVIFSSIFHFSSGRLVLSTELSNQTRQLILGSLAIRKFTIKPYYVVFLLMSWALNYRSVHFNSISQ